METGLIVAIVAVACLTLLCMGCLLVVWRSIAALSIAADTRARSVEAREQQWYASMQQLMENVLPTSPETIYAHQQERVAVARAQANSRKPPEPPHVQPEHEWGDPTTDISLATNI